MPHAITKDEVKELDEQALRWRLFALRADLPTHRSLTLASFETVSAELGRKRAQMMTSELSENCWL